MEIFMLNLKGMLFVSAVVFYAGGEFESYGSQEMESDLSSLTENDIREKLEALKAQDSKIVKILTRCCISLCKNGRDSPLGRNACQNIVDYGGYLVTRIMDYIKASNSPFALGLMGLNW
jgi:hypothetical protein